MLWFWARLCVEKKRMCLSAVPPPEARTEGLLGHQPIAFTAALCSWNLTSSLLALLEQTTSLLSLPPEAMQLPSGLHFSPQISCVWALYLLMSPDLRSQEATAPSLDPLASSPLDQSRLPTLPWWPSKLPTFFRLAISKTLICPLLFPMAMRFSSQKETEQMQSLTWLVSQSLVISEEQPDQRQREESRATAIWFLSDQSSRLRQKSSCRLGASSILQGFLLTFLIFFYGQGAILEKDCAMSASPRFLPDWPDPFSAKDMILWLDLRSISSRMPLFSSDSQLDPPDSLVGILYSTWNAQGRISLGMKRSPLGQLCRFSLFFNIKFYIVKQYFTIKHINSIQLLLHLPTSQFTIHLPQPQPPSPRKLGTTASQAKNRQMDWILLQI